MRVPPVEPGWRLITSCKLSAQQLAAEVWKGAKHSSKKMLPESIEQINNINMAIAIETDVASENERKSYFYTRS